MRNKQKNVQNYEESSRRSRFENIKKTFEDKTGVQNVRNIKSFKKVKKATLPPVERDVHASSRIMKEFLSQKPSKPSKGLTTDFRSKSPGKSNFMKIDEKLKPNSRILDQKIPKIDDENVFP